MDTDDSSQNGAFGTSANSEMPVEQIFDAELSVEPKNCSYVDAQVFWWCTGWYVSLISIVLYIVILYFIIIIIMILSENTRTAPMLCIGSDDDDDDEENIYND